MFRPSGFPAQLVQSVQVIDCPLEIVSKTAEHASNHRTGASTATGAMHEHTPPAADLLQREIDGLPNEL
jgi:hypothetical protein